MFKVPHRHFVMSIPSLLWPYLENDRKLWKIYMDSAIDTFNDYFPKLMHQRFLQVGIIVILHPFGKNLKFYTHLHVILTEGGFDKKGNFIRKQFIPAIQFRKCWMYHVLKNLQNAGVPNKLVSELYATYGVNGFHVWLHRAGTIYRPKDVAKYIGRYVRHPAIANSRITDFDGKTVKFFYNEHRDGKNERQDVVMGAKEFVLALLQHIPEKQFKMIRYYGAYARRAKGFYKISVQSSIGISKQITLKSFDLKFRPKCPKCGSSLLFIGYAEKPPPEYESCGHIPDEKIVDWFIPEALIKNNMNKSQLKN